MKGLEEHKYLLGGKTLKPCPFCGGEPFIDSYDRGITIGCKVCDYGRHFHGLVQWEIETPVVASYYQNTNRPAEWYDKDAYEKAADTWNRRANDG